MEDIGDILFYIIAAVIGLITTLGRKKKKPAGMPVPAKTENIDNQADDMVFEDYLNEIEYEVKDDDFIDEEIISGNEETIPVEQNDPFMLNPELEGNYEEPMAKQFKNEGESQFLTEEEKAEADKINDIEDDKDIISDFDLRKAVIFSEILKRNDY